MGAVADPSRSMSKRAPTPNLPALRQSQEVGHLTERDERVKALGEQAQSPRTRTRYAGCWKKFEEWCAIEGAAPLPADIATLCRYVEHLVSENFAVSSLTQAMAALRDRHAMKRIPKDQQPDWKDVRLAKVLKGARRNISERRAIRRARPLTDEDMRALVEMLRTDNLREARDLAIIVLAFAGCRRRSEVVGLDYQQRGPDPGCSGILEVDASGLTIVLLRSKTRQEGEPKKYFLNRHDVPRGCAAVEAWVRLAGIKPGTPLLRGLTGTGYTARSNASGIVGIYSREGPQGMRHVAAWKGEHLGTFKSLAEAQAKRRERAMATGVELVDQVVVHAARLSAELISDIIKARMFEVLKKRKLAEAARKRLRPEEVAECRRQAGEYSGHSGRRGSIQEADKRGVQRAHILDMADHKTGHMFDVYTSGTEIKKNKFNVGSGL